MLQNPLSKSDKSCSRGGSNKPNCATALELDGCATRALSWKNVAPELDDKLLSTTGALIDNQNCLID